MASSRTAQKQLSYPLYGVDFDPQNSDFLLVGGGGGSTASGIPNKITLLDVSRLNTINEVADINLAKDEDSLTTLAVLESNDNALTAYAGINGSVKDQAAGKNEHFRSFRIGLPAKKRKTDNSEKPPSAVEIVKTQSIARTALFRGATVPKSNVYQRAISVAPTHKEGGERVVAIASGLATNNEVLVLRATPSPSLSNVVSRIDVNNGEAADLDIFPVEDEAKSHVLAYCTDHDVYLHHIPSLSGKGLKEPSHVYNTPQSGSRSRIRRVRWLTSRYLLLLVNRAAQGGSELVVLKTDKDYTQSQEVLAKSLQRSTKQAVGLATHALSTAPTGDQQFAIAIVGQDTSIEILTLDWLSGAGMTSFRRYSYEKNVHAGPITGVTFSNFQSPPSPVSKDTKPQYIRLASVGVDMKVTVTTLPLRPHPATSRQPRYVLLPPSSTVKNALTLLTPILIFALIAFCTEIFCEIRGVVPSRLNAQAYLPPAWQRYAIPYPYAKRMRPFSNDILEPVIPNSLPPAISTVISATQETATQVATMLQDLVAEQQPGQQIVMRDSDGETEAELHAHDSHAVRHESVKKWDQLSEKEKKGWKKRLVDAGQWTEKQGETILKGILFSQLGAAVGAAVAG